MYDEQNKPTQGDNRSRQGNRVTKVDVRSPLLDYCNLITNN